MKASCALDDRMKWPFGCKSPKSARPGLEAGSDIQPLSRSGSMGRGGASIKELRAYTVGVLDRKQSQDTMLCIPKNVG